MALREPVTAVVTTVPFLTHKMRLLKVKRPLTSTIIYSLNFNRTYLHDKKMRIVNIKLD